MKQRRRRGTRPPLPQRQRPRQDALLRAGIEPRLQVPFLLLLLVLLVVLVVVVVVVVAVAVVVVVVVVVLVVVVVPTGRAPEEVGPGVQHGRRHFVQLPEAAEHEAVGRQPQGAV